MAYNNGSEYIPGDLKVDGALIAGSLTGTFASAAPASASATGTTGTITWASGFLYVCTATNTWQRVAIATW